MSWYYDYRPTIETDEGIKAKSKRGAFVKNWWATRWIEEMEGLMDRGRLQRGRRYARKGQVLSLTVEYGKVTANVQGSRSQPYTTSIQIEPLSEDAWERVMEALLSRPIFMAQLLAGEMPQNIEEAFDAVELSLFPTSKSALVQDCTCPDYASVCKHLAAAHYILAERFDEDPFLLFRLRGRSQDEILSVISRHDINDPVEYEPPLPLSPQGFWDIGGDTLIHFRTEIKPPEPRYPVLVRLGIPGFMSDLEDKLQAAYDAISKAALDLAFDDIESDEDKAGNDDLT